MATWLKDSQFLSDEDKSKARDFSKIFQDQIPIAKSLVASNKLVMALELLLTVEKQTRVAGDLATLKLVCLLILELCLDESAADSKASYLRDYVTILAKRRGQKSAALTTIVQKCMEYLNNSSTLWVTKSETDRIELIVVLRSVTDGKIFVEKERAQLTQMLSRIYESKGDVSLAADVLQECHVETYGAMTKLEKCDFILEQVRLTLEKKDYIRAYILSKKILRRTLEEEGFDQCKLKFYRLMITYHTHENDTLELCRHWMSIFSTPAVKEDPTQWKEAIEHAVLFAILSAHSNHQNDILCQLKIEKLLNKEVSVEDYTRLIKYFTTQELIAYPLPENAVIKAHPIMSEAERGADWFAILRVRVIEHNIRIIAKYYERIRMPAFANMLGLSQEDAENHMSTLVSNGTIYAKLNRPQGLLSFSAPNPPEQQLSSWAGDIRELLKMVETTCHLINKENMTYKVV